MSYYLTIFTQKFSDTSINTNKNYTNLINTNQLKKITDLQIINQRVPEAKSPIEQKKHKKDNVIDVPSPLSNYRVAELNDDFRGKEPPLFIHKGMTLTLKLHFSDQ